VPFLGHTCFVLAQAKAFPPSPGRRPTFTRAGSRLSLTRNTTQNATKTVQTSDLGLKMHFQKLERGESGAILLP
jgi:hypothetical protein